MQIDKTDTTEELMKYFGFFIYIFNINYKN